MILDVWDAQQRFHQTTNRQDVHIIGIRHLEFPEELFLESAEAEVTVLTVEYCIHPLIIRISHIIWCSAIQLHVSKR